ncbi:hypothetical protein OG944_38360 (plasmid) [Streptomyces anulatus]|uniref:hypothetical protein n=1 Tax=Streptomyces anulatus TaxID=1892 RepID=UPI00386C5FD0
MPRAYAPHEAISPLHVLALVRGLVEEAAEPRADRYRYFKSLFGTELHEAAAIRCGLVERASGDLRATPPGLDLYERHLRHLPDMAANYWHDQPHVADAVKEINRTYDQATTETPTT